jgi:hypothetical protein
MRCGYFDCFSGAAGDMILGALVDAGVPLDTLREALGRLKLPGVQLETEAVQRGGFAATQVHVEVDRAAQTHHRHLPDILDIIAKAGMSPNVTERAGRIFTRLAEAEARVHGIDVEHVHFHEVGAADAIVDIVGACVGVVALGLERITCSPIPTGSGTVKCEHGVLPVPAPATAELLRGVPLAECDVVGELTTPTGAAILTTLAESYGPLPALRVSAIGCGAGTRENRARPNLLRLFVGEADAARVPLADLEHDRVLMLETQVDDVAGQVLAHACERLLEAGALDAYLVPIIMKKGRPGQLLAVLCRPQDLAAVEAVLFREIGTLGVRRQEWFRDKLARRHVTVTTAYGPIRVKLGQAGHEVLRAWPEYEDCAAAARARGVALRDVQDAALQAWMQENARRDNHAE